MPKSRIPSPARSQGAAVTPRRERPRRSRSVASPALSTTSGRLTSVIDHFKEKNMASFALSPLSSRRSVLTDNTDIEEPKRRSWWKNLNENSRDVMEVLDNKVADGVGAIEELIDIEVLSQEKKNYTLDLPESSDSESINSIVLPQRKLFTQKDIQTKKIFNQLVNTREQKSNTTNLEKTINVGTKELFQTTKRTKPIFPEALLISPNKTAADKTKELPVEPKPQARNIFGNRPANKRRNMFANFIVSDSEDEIPEIQPKIFGFQKKGDHSRFPVEHAGNTTTDIDMDEWRHLPSSTMVEHQLEENMTGHTPVKRARLENRNNIAKSLQIIEENAVKTLEKENLESVHNIKENLENNTLDNQDADKKENNNCQVENCSGSEEKLNNNDAAETAESKENEKNAVVSFSDEANHENIFAVNDNLRKEQVTELINKRKENKSIYEDNNVHQSNDEIHDKENFASNEIDQEVERNKKDTNVNVDQYSERDHEENKNSDQIKQKTVQKEIDASCDFKRDSKHNDIGNKCTDENNQSVTHNDNNGDINSELQNDAENQDDGDEKESPADEINREVEQNKENKSDMEQTSEHISDEIADNENQIVDEADSDEITDNENSVGENQSDDETDSHEIADNEDSVGENEIENEANSNEIVDNENSVEENQIEDDAIEESEEVENNENEADVNESLNTGGGESVEAENNEDEDSSNDAEEAIASDEAEQESDQIEEMEVEEDNEPEESEELKYESDAEENQESKEDLEETPNTTDTTTGKTRNEENKSPEVVLHDKTNQADSFTTHGRNTSVRETKTMIKSLHIRPSIAHHRESTGISDGTKDSSAEGSGWDSHRTTRKTLRQTFGKDFTLRKSLRALVMEKSAKRQTEHIDAQSETVKFPQANSTELPEENLYIEETVEESDHELSRRNQKAKLEMEMQKIKQQNMETRLKIGEVVRNSLKAPPRDPLNLFRMPTKPAPRFPKPSLNKPKKQIKSAIPLGNLPAEVIEDMKYKPPKRFQPRNASWITKKLYKFVETKLEPKYDYKARVRAEKLIETLYNFVNDIRRKGAVQIDAIEVLKHEMARLEVVKTHFEFYEFFHEYMPREVRVKVVPDLVNKLPPPRDGVFTDIIRGNTV